MTGDELYEQVRHTVAAMQFASGMIHPNILQTMHRMALKVTPGLADLVERVPFDEPVGDLTFGTRLRPSEMQALLRHGAAPLVLVGIQSIAEESVNAKHPFRNIKEQIGKAATKGVIDTSLSNELHHWRMVRNVLVHGAGAITSNTAREASALGLTHFTLNRDKHVHSVPGGGFPDEPDPPVSVPIVVGQKLPIGLGDLLAAAKAWSEFMKAHGC